MQPSIATHGRLYHPQVLEGEQVRLTIMQGFHSAELALALAKALAWQESLRKSLQLARMLDLPHNWYVKDKQFSSIPKIGTYFGEPISVPACAYCGMVRVAI